MMMSFTRTLVFLLFILQLSASYASSDRSNDGNACLPGSKEVNGKCLSLDNRDVLEGIHSVVYPMKMKCNKIVTVQNISICEDTIDYNNCNVLSVLTTNYCDEYGTLEFEKYWSVKGCNVYIYQYTSMNNGCSYDAGNPFTSYPKITLIRNNVWSSNKCYNCLYAHINTNMPIDILKIQQRDGVENDFDSVQYVIMSDLYLHNQKIMANIQQISITMSININLLQDNVGREAEHAWNIWATHMLLKDYASVSSRSEVGPSKLLPLQFKHTLDQAAVPTNAGYYHHTYMKVIDAKTLKQNNANSKKWKPIKAATLRGVAPAFCKIPSSRDDDDMQKWILSEMNARCHPNRLWVNCELSRQYDGFIPCPQELMNTLAADYTAAKGWCDFTSEHADIPAFVKVDKNAAAAFNKPTISPNKVRIAFLFTLYSDAAFVMRLIGKLYSEEHYYLLHVDPAGSSLEFMSNMKAFAAKYPNVFIADDVPIVYGASTASILLSKAMAWYLRNTSGWDYLISVTGSDYPLVPLPMIEKMLQHQQPPMPFVMAWTPGTSTHLFRLQKTHPVFEYDPSIRRSITAVTDERGHLLGQVPMEYRSSNFGPPLFCENMQSFYHLDNRRNKTGTKFDTMWLFPLDQHASKGRAFADDGINPEHSVPTYDKVHRIWKKSDPATTAFYDRQSVEYIVNSEEGKKYFHFFRYMLLGSEEHYYVSLLYNWPRTKAFIQTLSAQTVWNTWELGYWDRSAGFQTHTHFLSVAEWEILQGFSARGMVFPRKFSHKKNNKLLDMIDSYIHNNQSTIAGKYWPGFYYVDTLSPGKQWVHAYRMNKTISNEARYYERMYGPITYETPKDRQKRFKLQQANALKLIAQEREEEHLKVRLQNSIM